MNQKQYLTKQGFEELQQHLQELLQEQKENIVALQEARAQGDLSENADYDAARDAQARIAAQIKETELHIKNAEIIDESEDNNRGKEVTILFMDDNEKETYLITGSIEADPLDFKISAESPLGQSVLHAKVGDVCIVRTEDGEKFEVKVLNIQRPKQKKRK